jgi:predicted RNase H-like HicB family nuclease
MACSMSYGMTHLCAPYIAEISDLEDCSAFGTTPAEALAEVECARDAWLAAAQEAGRPIPRPREHVRA